MRRILAVIGFLSIMPPTVLDARDCLDYGRVSLFGVLVRQTYPGPPDYESFSKGDEPQVILVLQLDQPTCVAARDAGYARLYNEREVQLVFAQDRYASYESLLGKRVLVEGDLLQGGARHEKRLVLAVREMAERARN
jgi:hypothetical protein